MDGTGRLLIMCSDQTGIVAKTAYFFSQRKINISDCDQHVCDGLFFMRLVFEISDEKQTIENIRQDFSDEIAAPLAMTWKIFDAHHKKSMAILVSKPDHGLLELFWRWKKGELNGNIHCVISNHEDLRHTVEHFEIPFHHISSENKQQSEAAILELTQGKVDVLILARYMQILSENFIRHYPDNIINIHHSFLPAFKGADPYKQAHDYGVKIIGATAHFVTATLDAGPIIEQDVTQVNHRHNIEDLRTLGRDLERRVLARAVKWFLDDKIIINGNKTLVFNQP